MLNSVWQAAKASECTQEYLDFNLNDSYHRPPYAVIPSGIL